MALIEDGKLRSRPIRPALPVHPPSPSHALHVFIAILILLLGVDRSPYPEAKEALQKTLSGSYWSSSHDRWQSQMVVWENQLGMFISPFPHLSFYHVTPLMFVYVDAGALRWGEPDATSTKSDVGCIIPQIVAAGTVTRRAVERTWLTGKLSAKFDVSIQCW